MPRKTTKAPIKPARKRSGGSLGNDLRQQDRAALAAVHAALDTPERCPICSALFGSCTHTQGEAGKVTAPAGFHDWPASPYASPMGATEPPPVAVIDTRKMLPENEL